MLRCVLDKMEVHGNSLEYHGYKLHSLSIYISDIQFIGAAFHEEDKRFYWVNEDFITLTLVKIGLKEKFEKYLKDLSYEEKI